MRRDVVTDQDRVGIQSDVIGGDNARRGLGGGQQRAKHDAFPTLPS